MKTPDIAIIDQKGALMSETAQQAYARGVEMGRVAIRLDHHDDRLDDHADLLAKTVETAQIMASTVQTLTEARVTDAATRVATAQAVKDAKDTQEDQAKHAWSPTAKLIAIIGSAVTVVAVLWAVLSSLPIGV